MQKVLGLSQKNRRPRFYHLRNRDGFISPCVISYIYGAVNEVSVNNVSLVELRPYWFRLCKDLSVNDRIEVNCTSRKSGELLRSVTTEVLSIKKDRITLVQLARYEKPINGVDLASESEMNLHNCPTCQRPLD